MSVAPVVLVDIVMVTIFVEVPDAGVIEGAAAWIVK